MIWNTLYHITYQGPQTLKDSILPVLDEVSRSVSVFDKNSLVTQLNDFKEITADYHLTAVYDASKKINRLSNGKFDPTVSPLIDAWGFGLGHQANTDTLAIDSIMNFIGINKTHREGNIIYKDDRRTRFNFSAIAKGYGCDAIGQMFKRNGVENYMIEIGGELTLSGKSPSGENWKIAVDSPSDNLNPGEKTALILSLTDVGIATSGNYRNFRLDGGQKVVHTISPLTGKPFQSSILSATVIATDCMEADGIATACMASTPKEAKKLLLKIPVEGILIFADSVWMTPRFSRYIISESSVPVETIQN